MAKTPPKTSKKKKLAKALVASPKHTIKSPYSEMIHRINSGYYDGGDPLAAFEAGVADIMISIADCRGLKAQRKVAAHWNHNISEIQGLRISRARDFLDALARHIVCRPGRRAKIVAREIFKLKEKVCCAVTLLDVTRQAKTFSNLLQGCLAEWAPDFWKYGFSFTKNHATSRQNAHQAMPSQRAAARKRKLLRRHRRNGGI